MRALTTFDHLPPGHGTFWVGNDGYAPHLNIGEFAVVDTTDRRLQHGELYLMQHDIGRRDRSIVQTKVRRFQWSTLQLRGWRKVGTLDDGLPLFGGMPGGPYSAGELEQQMLGRIVGVSSSPLGNLLSPAAGYQSEDACNASFNECDYLDLMAATGHEPRAWRRQDGRWGYGEKRSVRLSKEQERSCFAAWQKLDAASTGLDRVIAECVRRGLID